MANKWWGFKGELEGGGGGGSGLETWVTNWDAPR